MWVSLIQSADGLNRKTLLLLALPKQEGILPTDCFWTQTETKGFRPYGLPWRLWSCQACIITLANSLKINLSFYSYQHILMVLFLWRILTHLPTFSFICSTKKYLLGGYQLQDIFLGLNVTSVNKSGKNVTFQWRRQTHNYALCSVS